MPDIYTTLASNSIQGSSSLLMSMLLTPRQHIGAMHGQYAASMQCRRLSLSMVRGMFHNLSNISQPQIMSHVGIPSCMHSLLMAFSPWTLWWGLMIKFSLPSSLTDFLTRWTHGHSQTVIVMDNCPIHKCEEILDMITEWCVNFPLKISSLQLFLFTVAWNMFSSHHTHLISIQLSLHFQQSRRTSGAMEVLFERQWVRMMIPIFTYIWTKRFGL